MKALRSSHVTALFWTALGLWMATIWVLSSLSGPQLEPAFEFIPGDKVAHFIAFIPGGALLAAALWRSFSAISARRAAWLAVLAVGLFGALDEWHQTFTPHRSGADLGDWAADMLGAVTGAMLISLRYGTHRRQRED